MNAAATWMIACMAMPVTTAGAQQGRTPIDDSLGISVALVSRSPWRDISLGDEPAVISGISFPLRFIARGLQVELAGATHLRRDPFGTTDQYSTAARYQIPLRGAPHRRSLTVGATGYWAPGAVQPAPKQTAEATIALLWYVGIERLGIRTLGFTLDGVRDLRRENGTWLSGGAAVSAGTTFPRVTLEHSIIAVLRLSVSASDYRGPLLAAAPRPRFGPHSADAALDIGYGRRSPAGSLATRTVFQVGGTARARRLGPDVGWLGIRYSLLFF